MNTIKLIIALSLTASVTTALQAQTSDLPTIKVVTSDLNLNSADGQDRLALRVTQAAKQVCDYRSGSRDLGEIRAVQACIAKAKVQAMAEVRSRTSRQMAAADKH